MVLHPAIDDLASSESAAPQSTDIGRHSEEGSLVPIGDSCTAAKGNSLEYLVRNGDQVRRNSEAERRCDLQIEG